ncbi:hypothetical protein ACFE04_019653 [Oxalis oulophora]
MWRELGIDGAIAISCLPASWNPALLKILPLHYWTSSSWGDCPSFLGWPGPPMLGASECVMPSSVLCPQIQAGVGGREQKAAISPGRKSQASFLSWTFTLSSPGPMYSIYETSRAFLALREEGNQSPPTCYSNALYAPALAEYPYQSVVHPRRELILSLRSSITSPLQSSFATQSLHTKIILSRAFVEVSPEEPEPTRKPFALLDSVMQSQIFTSYAPKPTLYLSGATPPKQECLTGRSLLEAHPEEASLSTTLQDVGVKESPLAPGKPGKSSKPRSNRQGPALAM